MVNVFNKTNCFKEYEGIKSIHEYGILNNVPNPVVSILMPVYNRPETFSLSLSSAIKQEFDQPYEIVVVDNYDGKDKSPNLEIVKQAGATNVMYYRNESNLGMLGNWNRGIEMARAEYITFCHDDDILLPNCLSRLMDLQKRTGKKCILSSHNRIDANGNFISVYKFPHIKSFFFKEKGYYEYTLYNQFICSMGVGVGCLFNRNCLIDIGGYNKKYYPSADYALQVCYTYYYGCVINNIPTFNYREAINESKKIYRQFAEVDRILRQYMTEKINLPKWILNRIIISNYRISVVAFSIIWGGKEEPSQNKITLLDKLIMKFFSIPNKWKGYYLSLLR